MIYPEKLAWLEMSDAFWNEEIPDPARLGFSEEEWEEIKKKIGSTSILV